MVGLVVDPWQEFVLRCALGLQEDGLWSAFQVGLEVSRQNGKNVVLEVRQLAGLFVFDEWLQIHTAHLADTSMEAFNRLVDHIDASDDLRRRVRRVSRSHGSEGIELLTGQRIKFRTRTKGGGRGWTGDTLYFDEAMEIKLASHGAVIPTMSTVPNPQVWYTGSAVDQEIHQHCEVFARLRETAMSGDPGRAAYMGFSAEGSLDTVDPDDRDLWAQANPALGIRITEDYVASERRALDTRAFCVERLGVGDWPDLRELDDEQRLSIGMWVRCEDESSRVPDGSPKVFAADVTPSRSHSCVAVAGWRADGLPHVEVVEHREGTSWVAGMLARLLGRHETAGPVFVDGRGPAKSLLVALADEGVPVEVTSGDEMAQACGVLFDEVKEARLRHLGTMELATAVRGAGQRPLGDAWAWSRKASSVDISPLVAVTLALLGAMRTRGAGEPLIAWR